MGPQVEAATAVDADRSVAAVERPQHIAVSGQLEHPAAQEVGWMPRDRPHNRKNASWCGRAGFADDNAHSAGRRTGAKESERPVRCRYRDAPRGPLEGEVPRVNPPRGPIWPPRKPHPQPAASVCSTRSRHHEQPWGIGPRQPARCSKPLAGKLVEDCGSGLDGCAPGCRVRGPGHGGAGDGRAGVALGCCGADGTSRRVSKRQSRRRDQ